MPNALGLYTTPNFGSLPTAGRRILKAVYQKERASGLGQVRSAKIAWAAVKQAGFKESSFGKWVKQ